MFFIYFFFVIVSIGNERKLEVIINGSFTSIL